MAQSTHECRVCRGRTDQFLDLGRQPLSDRFVLPLATEPEFFFDLRVRGCADCGMVQLADEVPRDRMFTADYPFFTSSSSGMVDHFTRTAHRLIDEFCQVDDPFVVEIGANDGTMLETVASRGIRHLGVDPAGLAGRRAQDRGVAMLLDFFEARTAQQILVEHGHADVVYAANTMCHIPYIDQVFHGLDALLAADGVFVFEDPYLGDIIRLGSFDQIYDEHFYLFSASSVDALAKRWGMELIDVERLPVHGGEVRYTLARAGRHQRRDSVDALIREERDLKLHDLEGLMQFAAEVADRADRLVACLEDLRAQGLRVAGYAATAKSATVLNYCGIGSDLLPVIYDTTPEKQGLLTPGTGIPIAPFPAAGDDLPDVYLLFAWNHAAEIMAKEKDFVQRGGRWLGYVPEVALSGG